MHIVDASTDKCANTHPTAASIGADVNGMAVQDACQQINKRCAIIIIIIVSIIITVIYLVWNNDIILNNILGVLAGGAAAGQPGQEPYFE